MLARRVIAVSSDKAFSKQLSVALKAAGGTVDAYQSLEELGAGDLAAPLVVIHLDGDLAGGGMQLLGMLGGETQVIAILPRSNLAAFVEIMQASERVAGMMIADDFDTRELSAMATRVLAGDIFGLEKLTKWGTQIHSFLVGDYQEKSLCIAQVSQFAESMGVRRKYRESIEQCLDEMLMNALYDAPVDDQGRPIFSEIPTKTRISLRVEQKVVVQYVCDGKQFAVAVRDAFGTLERATVLRYLHKCLHSEQQIDRKVGGAGLGLYLMTSSSTSVYFNVLPGVATEAVCTFDLEAPKMQIEGFGFFTERIDAAGRLAGGPSRRLPAGIKPPVERRAATAAPAATPRGLVSLLVAAILITLGLVTVMAWPRLFGDKRASVTILTVPAGATIEVEGKIAGTAADGKLVVRDLEIGRAYPIVARLDGHEPKQTVVQPRDAKDNAITLELVALAATVTIDSAPSGATVEVGGKALGTTPVVVATLPPGQTVSLTFKKPGYQDAVAKLEVPRPGKETRLIQPLAVSQDLARIRLVSDPPGAQVVQNGQLIPAVTTPTEVLVEANKPVRFLLTLPNKVPAVIEPFTPTRGADDIVRSGKLMDGVALRVVSNVEGKAVITGAPHCQGVALPADCTVAPGTYGVEVVIPQGAKIVRQVKVGAKPVDVKVDIGYVDAGPNRVCVLPNGNARKGAFEVGPRRVTIADGETVKTVIVAVRAGATVVAP